MDDQGDYNRSPCTTSYRRAKKGSLPVAHTRNMRVPTPGSSPSGDMNNKTCRRTGQLA